METTLAVKLKQYEDKRRLETDFPIIARLDGVNFHSWTRELDKPYDERLVYLMQDTAKYLAREFNALVAYTQSDEISLTWFPRGESEPIYGGKVQKMASVLASLCTNYFNSKKINYNLTDKDFAAFDCRVFQLPDIKTAGEYFAWRQQDASRNAASMAAQHFYSPKQLHNKNRLEQIKLFNEKSGVPFHNLPEYFRMGTFFLQRKEFTKYSIEELAKLPPKHQAHTNPDLMVERTIYIYSSGPNRVSLSEWIYGPQ